MVAAAEDCEDCRRAGESSSVEGDETGLELGLGLGLCACCITLSDVTCIWGELCFDCPCPLLLSLGLELALVKPFEVGGEGVSTGGEAEEAADDEDRALDELLSDAAPVLPLALPLPLLLLLLLLSESISISTLACARSSDVGEGGGTLADDDDADEDEPDELFVPADDDEVPFGVVASSPRSSPRATVEPRARELGLYAPLAAAPSDELEPERGPCDGLSRFRKRLVGEPGGVNAPPPCSERAVSVGESGAAMNMGECGRSLPPPPPIEPEPSAEPITEPEPTDGPASSGRDLAWCGIGSASGDAERESRPCSVASAMIDNEDPDELELALSEPPLPAPVPVPLRSGSSACGVNVSGDMGA